MKTRKENVRFYIDLVNGCQSTQITLYSANGTNYIKKLGDGETIFIGTLKECYNFLLGVYRMF